MSLDERQEYSALSIDEVFATGAPAPGAGAPGVSSSKRCTFTSESHPSVELKRACSCQFAELTDDGSPLRGTLGRSNSQLSMASEGLDPGAGSLRRSGSSGSFCLDGWRRTTLTGPRLTEGALSMVSAGSRRKSLALRLSSSDTDELDRMSLAEEAEIDEAAAEESCLADSSLRTSRQSSFSLKRQSSVSSLKRHSSITPELLEHMGRLRRQAEQVCEQSDVAISLSEFYTEECIKQRAKLLSVPEVQHALECIWQACTIGISIAASCSEATNEQQGCSRASK